MPDQSALIMPWGKFKGRPIEEVPNWYVRWLAENANDERVCGIADKELQYREKFGVEVEE